MYITQLAKILENILSKYDDLTHLAINNQLTQELENKKFDLQDQALVEAIINDKEKQLETSLEENYNEMIEVLIKKYGSVSNTDPQLLSNEVISIFISNLEYYIDYFYNLLLNKHFSGG